MRDRNGRGIRRENRIFANLRFGLGEDRVLDLGILDDGLDHDIDIVETVVTQ